MPNDKNRDGEIKPLAHPLKAGFQILNISESHGTKLVASGFIRTIWLGPGTRRITEDEIQRLLREGIPENALSTLRRKVTRRSGGNLQKPAATTP